MDRHPYIAAVILGVLISALLFGALCQFNQGGLAYFYPGTLLAVCLIRVIPSRFLDTLFGGGGPEVFAALSFLCAFLFWALAVGFIWVLLWRRRHRHAGVAA